MREKVLSARQLTRTRVAAAAGCDKVRRTFAVIQVQKGANSTPRHTPVCSLISTNPETRSLTPCGYQSWAAIFQMQKKPPFKVVFLSLKFNRRSRYSHWCRFHECVSPTVLEAKASVVARSIWPTLRWLDFPNLECRSSNCDQVAHTAA